MAIKAKEKKTTGIPGLHLQRVRQGDKRGPCIYQDQAADGAVHTLRMYAGEMYQERMIL